MAIRKFNNTVTTVFTEENKIAIADLPLWEPPTQPDTWANTTMNGVTFLATFYDDYVGVTTGYTVTKTSLGKDQSGAYDVYKYIFAPDNYERTILLTTGVHGDEYVAMFALARFIYYMMLGTEDSTGLTYIKEKVRVIVLPLCNPWGFNQTPKNHYNSRGINLNRNFDSNGRWEAYVASAEDPKGEASYSEAEALILKNLFISLADEIDFYLDLHTGTAVYDFLVYYLTADAVIGPKIDKAIVKLKAVIEERLSRTATSDIWPDQASAIKMYYLYEQLGIQSASIEYTPQKYGGSYNGGLDIEYYMLAIAAYVFECLNVCIMPPTQVDRFLTQKITDLTTELNALRYKVSGLITRTITDTFDKADNATSLGSTDTGEKWMTDNGTFRIESNKARANLVGQSGNWIDYENSNFEVSVEINWRVYAGIQFRYKDENNYLLARISSTCLGLGQRVAGVATTPTIYEFTPVAGTTYTLKVVANGSSIKVYIDGVEHISVTETLFLRETKVGLRAQDDPLSTFDNFSVVNITT